MEMDVVGSAGEVHVDAISGEEAGGERACIICLQIRC